MHAIAPRRLTLALLAAVACGPQIAIDDTTGGTATTGNLPATTAASATSPSTSGGSDVPTVPPDRPEDDDGFVTTGNPPSDSTDDGVFDEEGGCLFLCAPDGGTRAFECDPIAQDCPRGEKCMPWANDGGPAWNATRCSPVADVPAGVGDACMVEGSGVSGIDDCDVGLMCSGVDADGQGVCQDMCTGSYRDPVCADPNDICAITNDGAITLCLPTCNPASQPCALAGDACYLIGDGDVWACAPFAGSNGYGEPCTGGECAAGSTCVEAAAFSMCGDTDCCTAYCDLDDGNADAACQALDPAQTCQPFYPEGQAPAGYENVGMCRIAAP